MLGYLIDDPVLSERSPGEEFAVAAARARGGDAGIRLRAPLTTRFPLASTRPRPTIREQTKVAVVATDPLSYVQELRAADRAGTEDTRYAATPEAGFQAHVAKAALTEMSVAVPIPGEICDDPALLARFVDHRVIVRLCTVENEMLLHGSADGAITGLLHMSGLRTLERSADANPLAALMTACAHVEEMGGSCDGLVMDPSVDWRLFGDGALASIDAAGLRITRTRMIAPDRVLLGDFRAGVSLLDGDTSTLSLRRPREPAVIEATMRIGLALHLPQHFVLRSL